MTWLYVLKLIDRLQSDSAWTLADEELVNRHFDRLKNDHAAGIVKLAGRTDQTDATGFGLVLFEAASRAEAIAYMNADPCVAGKIMTATLHRYRIALM